MKNWKTLEVSFVSESEENKQKWEKWLDEVFGSTSFRRTITKEDMLKKTVTITFEDTGARH